MLAHSSIIRRRLLRTVCRRRPGQVGCSSADRVVTVGSWALRLTDRRPRTIDRSSRDTRVGVGGSASRSRTHDRHISLRFA